MSEIHQLVLSEPARVVAPGASAAAGRSATHPAAWDGRLPSHVAELPGAAEGPTRVYIYAKDGILRAGVASQLRRSPQVKLAEEYGFDAGGVAVVAADEVGEEMVGAIRAIRRSCTSKVIVIANRLTRAEAEAAVHAGAWAFVRRSRRPARPAGVRGPGRGRSRTNRPRPSTTPWASWSTISSRRSRSRPSRPAGLTDRDVEVLRLMADGHSTAGIARDLSYSESTIKNIIHAIVRELGARNRAHAVAMALRAQLI